MPYRIKQLPEDFVVREDAEVKTGKGPYAYYLLAKKGWTTQSAATQAARAFGKRLKFVNFSGNKDKNAVTEQYISILHGPRRDLELQGGSIMLTYIGHGRERLNLGFATGNRFEITVRGLGPRDRPRKGPFPNYFDEQRFGREMKNHLAGRMIVRRDFQAACSLIPEARSSLPSGSRDFVGALRSLPRRVLRLYAHSYQSWLWNLSACRFLEGFPHRKVQWPLGELVFPLGEVPGMDMPILGYGTEMPKELEPILAGILSDEGISLEDFRLKQFPEFDLAGTGRSLMVTPSDLALGRSEDDELNAGMKKMRVAFSLPSGSYATMAIRFMFS